MTTSRRRVLQTLPLSVAVAAAQEPPLQQLPVLNLSEERLRVLRPVLAQRQASLRALRDFPIGDSVRP